MRFYALRLHEIGLIKSTPQKIIAQGTDWRFFNEIKKELKDNGVPRDPVGFTPRLHRSPHYCTWARNRALPAHIRCDGSRA